jgi:hypothetical protein
MGVVGAVQERWQTFTWLELGYERDVLCPLPSDPQDLIWLSRLAPRLNDYPLPSNFRPFPGR